MDRTPPMTNFNAQEANLTAATEVLRKQAALFDKLAVLADTTTELFKHLIFLASKAEREDR